MCAQFMIRARAKSLAARFGIKIPKEYEETGWSMHVMPYRPGLSIVKLGGSAELKEMQFSLVPSWSKEPRVKFATHNARIEDFDDKKNKVVWIYEKPTWRGPFSKRHCIIPMTEFIEPIYTGEFAGHMVRFFPKDGTVLGAAAIWDEWLDKKTGEVVESFSVITDDPIPFVRKIGHDRSPLFIKESSFNSWLSNEGEDPKSLVEFLRASKDELDLSVESERPMKSGWEKRIPKS